MGFAISHSECEDMACTFLECFMFHVALLFILPYIVSQAIKKKNNLAATGLYGFVFFQQTDIYPTIINLCPMTSISMAFRLENKGWDCL
jgi:hypothetical protein